MRGFVPRNIKKRVKDYQIIKKKQLKSFETFLLKLPDNSVIDALQEISVTDLEEQLFLSLIMGSKLKINVDSLNVQIFKKDKLLFQYDWQEDILWFNYSKTYFNFYNKFKMSFICWKQFIKNQIEKYYNFRPKHIADSFIDLQEKDVYT